jgi:hypothetical protein
MRYVIQYEGVNGGARMQDFDSRSRAYLVKHLAKFERPILNVFEQSTPITKAVRAEMAAMKPATLSRAAKEFIGISSPA